MRDTEEATGVYLYMKPEHITLRGGKMNDPVIDCRPAPRGREHFSGRMEETNLFSLAKLLFQVYVVSCCYALLVTTVRLLQGACGAPAFKDEHLEHSTLVLIICPFFPFFVCLVNEVFYYYY